MTLNGSRRVPREFDRLASSYARRHTQKSAREAREFIDWIQVRCQESILDAACGPGALARAVARRGAQAFALDISPRMLEFVGSERHRWLIFPTLGDVETLPYAEESFDLVACAYAFANFPSPLTVLREFARVTRADGRIAIIDVVAPENPRQHSRLNEVEARRSHLDTHILSRAQFLHFFEAAGLVVLRSASHRRRQSVREWVELSPALRHQPAARVRSLLRKSANHQRMGLYAHRPGRAQLLTRTTEWFLLCKPTPSARPLKDQVEADIETGARRSEDDSCGRLTFPLRCSGQVSAG